MNSLTAHKILKQSSIEAYNNIHDYDFTCISETYLDSSVSLDDNDIAVEGYNIVCADHHSSHKKGGVCINNNESVSVQFININFLNECLLCELTFDNKKGYVTVLYRSPSQNGSNLTIFFQVLEICLMSLVFVNLTFQLSLVTLMQDQNLGGRMI